MNRENHEVVIRKEVEVTASPKGVRWTDKMREKDGEWQQKIKHSIKRRSDHNSANGLELTGRWNWGGGLLYWTLINLLSKCQFIVHNSGFMFQQLIRRLSTTQITSSKCVQEAQIKQTRQPHPSLSKNGSRTSSQKCVCNDFYNAMRK